MRFVFLLLCSLFLLVAPGLAEDSSPAKSAQAERIARWPVLVVTADDQKHVASHAEAAGLMHDTLDTICWGAEQKHTVPGGIFTDVPDNHPHAHAINQLVGDGIIQPVDKLFRPEEATDRYTLAIYLARMAGAFFFDMPEKRIAVTNDKLPFTDVPEAPWCVRPIQDMTTIGVFQVGKDAKFHGSDPVTMATLKTTLNRLRDYFQAPVKK
jgi:hypothetical protein